MIIETDQCKSEIIFQWSIVKYANNFHSVVNALAHEHFVCKINSHLIIVFFHVIETCNTDHAVRYELL